MHSTPRDFFASTNSSLQKLKRKSLKDDSPGYTFLLDYQSLYETISELYYPMLNNFQTFEGTKISFNNIIKRLTYYLYHNKKIFACSSSSDLNEFNKCEMLIIIIIFFYGQVVGDYYFNFCDEMTSEDILTLYSLIKPIISEFYTSVVNVICVNAKKNETMVSFEELCLKYANNKKINQNKSTLEDEIQKNIENIISSVREVNRFILDYLKSSSQNAPLFLMKKLFREELRQFESLNENLFGLSYGELREYALKMAEISDYLINKDILTVPFLTNKPTKKFTLVVDLDDTLVNVDKEDINKEISIRPYVSYFLEKLSKNFEIILFTASIEEYAEYVVEKIDKKHRISKILHRKYLTFTKSTSAKDLSKLGRDLSKVVIIDNDEENFSFQPKNGILIPSYTGNVNDKELYFITNDLASFADGASDKTDITTILPSISVSIANRAKKYK